MAAGRIVVPPYFPARDRDNQLLSGALLYVYTNQTTTKATIYTDSGLSVLSANPVVANASGQFPAVWAEAGTESVPVLYSVGVTAADGDSPGNPFVFDNYRPSVDWETAAAALAEAAATAAAASAVDAASSATDSEVAAIASEAALAEILEIAADAPEAPSIANKANLNGNNVTGSNATAFRTAIGAVSSVALADETGASLVGFQNGGANDLARTVTAKLQDVPLSAADYSTLSAAITEACATGRELRLDGVYTIASALDFTLAANVKITCTDRTTITYTGVTQAARMIRFLLNGFSLEINGNGALVDGANLANVGIRVSNESGTSEPNVSITGLRGQNFYLVDGSLGTVASFLRTIGGFNRVTLWDVHAENVSRAAGIVGGTSQAVIVERSGASRAPLHIVVENCSAKSVTTEDAPGTALCVDCDGFALFQNEANGESCYVRNIVGYNCQGRTLKLQSRNPDVDNVTVFRNIRGIYTGDPATVPGAGSKEVAVQYGIGNIKNVTVTYAGSTTLQDGAVPVAAFSGEAPANAFGALNVENVTVYDLTASIYTIQCIVLADYNLTDTLPRLISIDNVKMIGSAQTLVSLGSLGTYAKTSLNIRGFIGQLTAALATVNGNVQYLRATVSGVLNTGTSVPVVRRLDGVSVGNQYGKWNDAGGNEGVAKDLGVNGSSTGIPGLGCDIGMLGYAQGNNSYAQGLQTRGTVLLADTASIEFDTFGYVPGNGIFFVLTSRNDIPGQYSTTGNTITAISSSPSITTSSTGSSPGSGLVRVWKSSTGTKVTVENQSGGNLYVTLLVVG